MCLKLTLQSVLVVKNLLAKAADPRDAGSIPGLGRSPGGGRGNLLQCSCLENPMNRGAWQATVHGVMKESDMTERLSKNLERKVLIPWGGLRGMLWEKVDKFILKAQIVNILSLWAMKSLSQLLTEQS